MVVYGVKGFVSNVDPAVYDKTFVVERGNMVMETNLDMNGHKLLNYAPSCPNLSYIVL